MSSPDHARGEDAAPQETGDSAASEAFELIATAVHDLKKPLTVVKTVVSLLKTERLGLLSDKQKQAIGQAADASDYMQQLVTDLLEYTQLRREGRNLPMEEVALRDVVDQVLRQLQHQAEAAGADVVIGRLPVVIANRQAITKVLMNLVGNALAYVRDGVTPALEIAAETADGSHVVHVSDNGCGIPEDCRAKVFDKFTRGTNVKGTQGTGLGLSIVKDLVAAHDGRIWFETEVGAGTTFRFSLPISRT